MGIRDERRQTASTHTAAHAHTTPLLVVSPTSPISKPSFLPTAVSSKERVAPFISCSSWLHLPEAHAHGSHNSSLAMVSHHPGFKGSRIPIRSVHQSKNSSSLGRELSSHIYRSKSLNLLSDKSQYDSPLSLPRHHPSRLPLSSPPSPRLALPAANWRTPGDTISRRSSDSSHQNNRSHVQQQSSLSYRSQSSSSLSACHRCHKHHTTWESLYRHRGRRQSASMLEHEPYQTPHHYTFHLTLRSPSPSPSRAKSRSPVSLNLSTEGGKNDDANRDVNVVDKTADALNRNTHGEAWSSKNHEDAQEQDIHHQFASEGEASNKINTEQQDEIEIRIEYNQDMPDCNRDENSNKNDNCDFNLNFDSLLPYQCNNFGIIDCLNTIVKEAEQDDTESYCSDYENGLTTSPPRRFSDIESTIETYAVSSDVPLKGYPASRLSFISKKKPNLQTVRWKSCHELVNRDVTKTMLRRQTSEHSLMSVKEEQVLPITSVAVYDYIESCPRYLNHGASDEVNKHTFQELPLCNTHNLCKANSAEYRNEQKTYEKFSREKFLIHNKAGENGDFCCHDSLVVDTSNSYLEEPMELDNYVMPPLTSSKHELSASWKAPLNLETSPNHPRKYTSDQTIYRSCDKENNAFRSINPHNDYMHITCNRQIDKDNIKLVSELERKSHPCYTEMDRVLGIQEDDGSGPGLSEDENLLDTFALKECRSLEQMGVVSPHKLLWYLQKESQRHNNESSISRLHPLPSDTGKTMCKAALIAPPDYRHHIYEKDIVCEASRPSSACSHPSDVYPDLLQGDISGEDSDTGVDLSELERCVLALKCRRKHLKKQDTNAFLIAPPEYKINENSITFPERFHC